MMEVSVDSIRGWTTWHGQQAFKAWVLVVVWLEYVEFNQSLDNVTWPAGLQSLSFKGDFNQRLDNVTWPAGLQSLTFGREFNHSLENVTWPAGLQSIGFGEHFNQSLDNVTWPAGLQSLTFVKNLQSLQHSDVLPGSLGHLAIGGMSLKCWNAAAIVSLFAFRQKAVERKVAERNLAIFPHMSFSWD